MKAAQAILPAGQVTPGPKPYTEGGRQLKDAEVTPAMQEVAAYAQSFALHVLSARIQVAFKAEVTWPYGATYGPGFLTFNVGKLGRAWFDLSKNRIAIDELLIHEFGHHLEGNHLDDNYHKALCHIGAKYAALMREGKKF